MGNNKNESRKIIDNWILTWRNHFRKVKALRYHERYSTDTLSQQSTASLLQDSENVSFQHFWWHEVEIFGLSRAIIINTRRDFAEMEGKGPRRAGFCLVAHSRQTDHIGRSTNKALRSNNRPLAPSVAWSSCGRENNVSVMTSFIYIKNVKNNLLNIIIIRIQQLHPRPRTQYSTNVHY